MPARDDDALLAHLGRVARVQLLEVLRERAAAHHLGVLVRVEGRAEEDVVAHRLVEHPCLLRDLVDEGETQRLISGAA